MLLVFQSNSVILVVLQKFAGRLKEHYQGFASWLSFVEKPLALFQTYLITLLLPESSAFAFATNKELPILCSPV